MCINPWISERKFTWQWLEKDIAGRCWGLMCWVLLVKSCDRSDRTTKLYGYNNVGGYVEFCACEEGRGLYKLWIVGTCFDYNPTKVNCDTAQKMKFSIKDFFSKCDQICSFLQIWSHLLQKSFMKNLIFCAVWRLNISFSSQKIKQKKKSNEVI